MKFNMIVLNDFMRSELRLSVSLECRPKSRPAPTAAMQHSGTRISMGDSRKAY
jgi:hypothetical protein